MNLKRFFFFLFLFLFLNNNLFLSIVSAKETENDDLTEIVVNLKKMPQDIQKEILYHLMFKVKNFLATCLIAKKKELKCTKFILNSSFLTKVVFSNDGKKLILGLEDGSIEIWDIATKSLVLKRQCFKKDSLITALCLDAKGEKLAIASSENNVKILNFPSLEVTKVFTYFSQPVYELSFSNDSNYLATCSYDMVVKVIDLILGDTKNFALSLDGYFPYHIVFSKDSKSLFLCFYEKEGYFSLLCVDIKEEKEVFKKIFTNKEINFMYFSPDGKKYGCYMDGYFKIGSIFPRKKSFKVKIDDNKKPYYLVFSNNNSKFLICSFGYNKDGIISLWSKDGFLHFINEDFFVTSLSFSLDNTKFLYSTFGRIVKVFELYDNKDKEILSYFDSIHKLTANQMLLLYLLFKNRSDLKGKRINLLLTTQELEKKYGYCELLDLEKSYKSLPLNLKEVVRTIFKIKDEQHVQENTK